MQHSIPTECPLCKSELKITEYKDCVKYKCTKCSWELKDPRIYRSVN